MTQSPFLGAKRHVYTYLALKCSWFLSCIIRVIPNHNMGIPRYSITICCAIDIYDLWECEQPQPASQMRWRYQGDCESGSEGGIEGVRGGSQRRHWWHQSGSEGGIEGVRGERREEGRYWGCERGAKGGIGDVRGERREALSVWEGMRREAWPSPAESQALVRGNLRSIR